MLKLQLLPPDAKSLLMRKYLDTGKDLRQGENEVVEDKMVR